MADDARIQNLLHDIAAILPAGSSLNVSASDDTLTGFLSLPGESPEKIDIPLGDPFTDPERGDADDTDASSDQYAPNGYSRDTLGFGYVPGQEGRSALIQRFTRGR